MSSTPLPPLRLYGRPGCHLCDDARLTLAELLAERRSRGLPVPAVEERDVTTDPDWERRYAGTIPVVELGGRELMLVTSAGRLRRLLSDVLGGLAAVSPPPPISPG